MWGRRNWLALVRRNNPALRCTRPPAVQIQNSHSVKSVETHLCTARASPISLGIMAVLLLAGDCHLVTGGQRPVAGGELVCKTWTRLHPWTMLLVVLESTTAPLSSLLVGGYNQNRFGTTDRVQVAAVNSQTILKLLWCRCLFGNLPCSSPSSLLVRRG